MTHRTGSAKRQNGFALLLVLWTMAFLALLVAQFTALYHLHSATSSAAIKTVGTGGNHAWAPIPLASSG